MRKFCLFTLFLFCARVGQGQTPGCTTLVNSYPYSEKFANDAGGWTSGGTNSSRALGRTETDEMVPFPTLKVSYLDSGYFKSVHTSG